MEKAITEVMEASLPLKKLIIKDSELSPDVELLSREEIINGLNAMASEKRAQLNLEAYREKLLKNEVVNPLTVSEFKNEKIVLMELYDLSWTSAYDRVLNYFAGIEGDLDLSKGIIISGSTGTGKTELMKLFSINPNCPFRVVSCRDVAKEFMKSGSDTLLQYKYLVKNLHRNKAIFGSGEWFGICFDDLGTEASAKNFGNNLNVMAEVIQDRYDLKNHKYTHITTNLSTGMIKEIYGDRVYSRMAEMFNIVDLGKDAIDMRLKKAAHHPSHEG